MRQITSNLP